MLIHTDKILTSTPLSTDENLQAYCGLDSMVMLEILEEIDRIHPERPKIYDFSRALQAPYLDIMQRGFAIDELARQKAAQDLQQKMDKVQALLDQLARAVWDKPLNPRSPQQLKEFFFTSMGLPEVWLSKKGERKLSTSREALEKLDNYLHARPIISCILTLRDAKKQLEVFTANIDFDHRYRTSYNIAGTETGRPSSSTSAFGTGGNMQNINPALRYVFVADRGFKLGVIDLEQVEARDVGYFCGTLCNDWTFLDACESGDLHTNNSKLVWPELNWTGERSADRKIADTIFYREFSYRDMSKRGGHLSNYFGTAYTMSRSLKIPMEVAEEFQARYIYGRAADPKKGLPEIIPAFPCILRWWQWVATELQTKHFIVNPFGRKRYFFGRHNDDATLREAIANLPQGTTADRMNLGLWRIWHELPQVQLLGQGFDSVVFQYPEDLDEDLLIPKMLKLIEVELFDKDHKRRYIVPGEAKIGWNWGYQVTEEDIEKAKAKGRNPPRLNSQGLIKWKKGQKDTRKRFSPLSRIERLGQ